jgi:hypothetical protein
MAETSIPGMRQNKSFHLTPASPPSVAFAAVGERQRSTYSVDCRWSLEEATDG